MSNTIKPEDIKQVMDDLINSQIRELERLEASDNLEAAAIARHKVDTLIHTSFVLGIKLDY